MARRINLELARAEKPALQGLAADPLAAVAADERADVPALPRDLPAWARDAVAISARARDLVARLKPVVIRVLTFWDHRARTAVIGGRRMSIDPSGSYRVN
jgi:hypothetical protein